MQDDAPIDAIDLPPDVGVAFQFVLDLHARPDTLGEWVEAVREALADQDLEITVETLCTDDDGLHVARYGDESQAFICVLDALLVPFAPGVEGPVHVESTPPNGGPQVSFDVASEAVTVDPPEAMISLGALGSAGRNRTDPPTPKRTYQELCPYVHAFPSRDAYEAWAASVDAATTAVPAARGFDVAAALAGGERVFEGGDVE